MVLSAPLPPSRLAPHWVNPLTPLTRPSAGRGTEASAVRARGRAATSCNWQRLRDFYKLIRHRKGSRGTTHPSDADRVQVWAVEVGATMRGSGQYVRARPKSGVFSNIISNTVM